MQYLNLLMHYVKLLTYTSVYLQYNYFSKNLTQYSLC